jgi:ATP-dependent helicase HrpA
MLNLDKTHKAIANAMISDQFSLRRKLKRITEKSVQENSQAFNKNGLNSELNEKKNLLLKQFEHALETSITKRKSRKVSHTISYPESLPVSQKVSELKKLIRDNQLIIVAGETGSGKSTQLPKLCLELGLAEGGMIGHTQPRRIAARTLTARISEELSRDIPNAEQESLVACKVRFSDSVKQTTQIKLMTDGMLLAEIQNDAYLENYQCIIIDEAHERSLNIDFLLGFLKRLLNKRKDLKVIITSATIDVDKMSKHFDNAPIFEVSGRSFPVDIHYLDYESSVDDEQAYLENNDIPLSDVLEKVLSSEFSSSKSYLAQDILVFLATENEIRQYSKLLRKHFNKRIDVLPLYGRMPLAQQREIFSPKSKNRRVILASNVAETSVTVPSIGFVIDLGKARISRYSARTKVQQLPIEKVSQASANQRAGRCGRIAPGVCIRIYSQEDFEARPKFTQPEIQRTNLASVILKMESMNLGRIEKFPLLDIPDKKLVKDAYKLLFELEAINKHEKLTNVGKQMASLPIEPRFSRMLIEAIKLNCLEEVLVIVCGLSVNDPRQRPQEYAKQADAKHIMFKHKQSDFLGFYKLWHLLEDQRRSLTNSKFKRFCEDHFIAWNNVREWREMHRQLLLQLRAMHLKGKFKLHEKEFTKQTFQTLVEGEQEESTKGKDELKAGSKYLYQTVHKAILKGCLSYVAQLSEGYAYNGTTNRQLYIFPASSLMKQTPAWIMSAQLIETSRLYAHCCAEIQSEWIIEQGQHLLSKKLFEPYWSKKRGCVQAYQQLAIGGLIVEARKPIKVSMDMSKELRTDLQDIFIQAALIERRYFKAPELLKENWRAIDKVKELEQKLRRVDLLPEDYDIVNFYKEKIPDDILDIRSFESWIKKQDKNLLSLNEDWLLSSNKLKDQISSNANPANVQVELVEKYPDYLPNTSIAIACKYVFDPLLEEDGLNIFVRFDQLNQLNQNTVDWLVPGLLREKCEALIKTLPKSLRKQCLPVQGTVDTCLTRINFGQGDLLTVLANELKRIIASPIDRNDFQQEKLPKHLRCHITVIDDNNKIMAKAWDLNALRKTLRGQLSNHIIESKLANEAKVRPVLENKNNSNKQRNSFLQVGKEFKTWNFEDIEQEVFFDKKIVNNSRKTPENSEQVSEQVPEKVPEQVIQQKYRVKMYSALKSHETYVTLQYLDSFEEAAKVHAIGQCCLMALSTSAMKRDIKKQFFKKNTAALKLFSAGDHTQIFEDLYNALINQVFFIDEAIENAKDKNKGIVQALPLLVYRQSDFESRLDKGKAVLYEHAQKLFDILDDIADKVYQLRQSLSKPASDLRRKHMKMIESHLLYLIRPNFISETPLVMLLRYPLYIEGMLIRLSRLQGNIDRDQALQNQIDDYREAFKRALAQYKSGELLVADMQKTVIEFPCYLEEFALSQFAQNKKTLMPVSAKILEQNLAKLAS